MSSKLIGALLDEALSFVRTTDPGSTVALFATDSRDQYGRPWCPRSAARSQLAKAIRASLTTSRDEPTFGLSGGRRLTYRDLVSLPNAFNEIDAPDIIVRDRDARAVAAIEFGYGFEPDTAMAAIDRLLAFVWFARARPAEFKSLDMIAYLFVHERGFGEDIRETEQRIDAWIGDRFGPFNGIDRIALPMMPRLTRSVCISSHGRMVSATGLERGPTGYAAFCISYQMDQP